MRWATVATTDMGRKEGGGCCAPFAESCREAVKHNVAWAEVYFCTKWHLHPSSRFATIDMNRKLGAVPLLVEMRPHLTRRLGRRLPKYQVASSSIQPFGHNIHGPEVKWGWVCLFSGESWVPIEQKVAWAVGRSIAPYPYQVAP